MPNQKVAPSKILLPLLEESYRAEYAEWSRQNLRYSDAGAGAPEGQKCERQIYYDLKMGDQKSSLTTGSLVLFDDGRLHEADIRRRLRLILRSPEKEQIEPKTGARGKMDNTIYRGQVDKDLKADPGLEIKSVNHFGFVEMANNGQLNQEYYDQIQLYLLTSGAPFFICLIKNRNSLGADRGEMPFLEFRVDPDAERQTELIAGLLATKQAAQEGVLPPRPFLRESTQCSFCRFKHICWDPVEVVEKKIEREIEGQDVDPKVLEAALKIYVDIRKKIDELEKSKEGAMEVIVRHFKAVKKDQEIIANIKAVMSIRYNNVVDAQVLRDKLNKDQLIAISIPNVKLLEEMIEQRQVDASVLDEALKKVEAGRIVRVTEITDQSKRLTTLQPKGGQDGRKQESTPGKKLTAGRINRKPRKRRQDHGLDKKQLLDADKKEQ